MLSLLVLDELTSFFGESTVNAQPVILFRASVSSVVLVAVEPRSLRLYVYLFAFIILKVELLQSSRVQPHELINRGVLCARRKILVLSRLIPLRREKQSDPACLTKNSATFLSSTEKQIALANRLAKTSGMPIVRIARPGTYGSTGMNHKWRRQPIEAHLVNAAVTQIKEKLGYERISLAGLSGGGGLVAAMLSLGRTDVNCAVIGAGATNVKLRMQHYGWLTYSKGNDATGVPLSSVYDPVDHVSEVKPDPNRRVFIVGDPRDVQVIYSSQVDYASKLAAAGTPNTILEAQAFDTNHHQVAFQAQWVSGWCNKGWTDEQMQAKLSAPRQLADADPGK